MALVTHDEGAGAGGGSDEWARSFRERAGR